MFTERSMTRQEFIAEYGYEPLGKSTVVQFVAPNGEPILRVYLVEQVPLTVGEKLEVEWLERLYALRSSAR